MNGVTTANGGNSSGLTLAQKMMMQHEQNDRANSTHKPAIEEVVDEEDVAHPATHTTLPGPVLEVVDDAAKPEWVKQAEKAAETEKPVEKPEKKKAQPLDLKSDEAFPSLGGPKPSTPSATMWGAKPASISRPIGTNGHSNGYASSTSSRASTPASGNRTPAGAAPIRLRGPGGQLQLPGRTNQQSVETITLLPEQLTPRTQLKKPAGEILRDIQTRTKASLQMSTSGNGMATFIVKGSPEAVRSAIRDIGKEFGLKKTLNVQVPIWARQHVIGRQGATIQKISEKTGAKVQMPKQTETEDDDEALVDVTIEGDAYGVEQAKSEIERIVRDRQSMPRQKMTPGQKADKPRGPAEDEITLNLKISPQYHRELIGARGSQVNRLQDRYGVRVNFPRSLSASASDAGSEYGGLRSPRPQQASDEVIIRGSRKGAEEARDELLGLLQYIAETSFTDTVSVQAAQISSLIGQGGREIAALRLDTGAHIDVPQVDKENSNGTERVQIKLKGTKKQVEAAKKAIQERSQIFDKTIVKTIKVDKKHHKALIGGQGAKIRDIVVAAGGSDDRRELARTVRFPKQDSGDNEIRVEGEKQVVNKIVAEIEKLVKERESSVTETIDVAPEKHRLLIGRQGETRQGLEKQFNVNIDVPRQSESTPSGVKISGQPSAVEEAKAHILQLLKENEGQTFQVPRHLHHTVADNGQFFRRLRNDHKVTVDHSGHAPPKRPDPAARRPLDAPLPLITDTVITETVSWEIYDTATPDMDEGVIPWILRGPPENVVRAGALLEAALAQARRESAAGYLVLPDPSKYRYVVGPGGSQVNAIRKQTGCRILIPRDQAVGEPIEILGDRESVEKAKGIILEVLAAAMENGGANGFRSGSGFNRRG